MYACYLFIRSLRGGTGGGGADLVGTVGTAAGPAFGLGGTAGPGASLAGPFMPFCLENSFSTSSPGGGGGGEPGSPRKLEGGGGASIPGLPKSEMPVGREGAAGAGLLGSIEDFTRSFRGLGTGGCSSFVLCTKSVGLTAGICGAFSSTTSVCGGFDGTSISVVGEVRESSDAWFLALGLGTGAWASVAIDSKLSSL